MGQRASSRNNIRNIWIFVCYLSHLWADQHGIVRPHILYVIVRCKWESGVNPTISDLVVQKLATAHISNKLFFFIEPLFWPECTKGCIQPELKFTSPPMVPNNYMYVAIICKCDEEEQHAKFKRPRRGLAPNDNYLWHGLWIMHMKEHFWAHAKS